VAEEFTCAVDEKYRSACKDLPKYSGSRYCVLHEPDEEKKEAFEEVKKSKLAGKDYDFGGTVFPDGTSDFKEFEFDANVSFEGATFIGAASFREAQFSGKATEFWEAQFSGKATTFAEAQFSSEVTTFAEAQFSSEVTTFAEAQFSGAQTYFSRASFAHVTYFSRASFAQLTTFLIASFGGRWTSPKPPSAGGWTSPEPPSAGGWTSPGLCLRNL
jgi:hypothetical protein